MAHDDNYDLRRRVVEVEVEVEVGFCFMAGGGV